MDPITRKGFLKSAAGLAVGRTATAAPPAQITQAELQHFLDLWTEMDRTVRSVRQRMEAGAAVEPGPLAAMCRRSEPMPECEPYTGAAHRGLDVGPSDDGDLRDHAAKLEAICAGQGRPGTVLYGPVA